MTSFYSRSDSFVPAEPSAAPLQSLSKHGLVEGLNVGTTGQVVFTFFTQPNTTVAAITKFMTATSNVAAAATPTLCKIGLYTSDGTTLTRVAVTANTTSLWAATYTEYETALTASYTPIPGQRYASALLCVSAGATPNLYGQAGNPVLLNTPNKVAMLKGGESDLAATYAISGLSDHYLMHYVGGIA